MNTCAKRDGHSAIPLIVALVLALVPAAVGTAKDRSYRVLVLHSHRISLQVNNDWVDGLVQGFTTATDVRIEIDIETPDLTRLDDVEYANSLRHILDRKYRDKPPDLIIPTYTPALKFILDYGEDLFPGVPVVFCAADERLIIGRELPPYVTGITAFPDFAGTLEVALGIHPDRRRVALIVGSGALDKQFERDARLAFEPFENRVDFAWLQGMPLAELEEAVDNLPRDTVLLYLLQLEDRTGKNHIPIVTVQALSARQRVPIYGLWDTLLGHGIVGGRLATLSDDGFQAALMGLRILGGEPPRAISVVRREQNPAIFHGGEMARWNIDEDQLPDGSRILNRQLSLWEAYRTEFTIGALVIAVQGFLIFVLLLNRARLKQSRVEFHGEHELRVHSERVASNLRARLARFSKERALGAMTTGIAHEINQPLIAIQNYAQAANRRLDSGGDQTPKLTELLAKIEQQAGRAGDIIGHVRTLVSDEEPELHAVALHTVIEQVIDLLEIGIENQSCSIDCRMAADLPPVLADALGIQLVLVNLLQNAVQSVERKGDSSERNVIIDVGQIDDQHVQVSVADRGTGIHPDEAKNIFDPLYTDKARGMGMGLAICRTIIEGHGGRIWHEPGRSGGAVFMFTLRLAETERQ